MTAANDAGLLEKMTKLSPGDLSCLETALNQLAKQPEQPLRPGLFGKKPAEPGSVGIMTVRGSANDALFADLVGRGWMKLEPPIKGAPPGIDARSYTLLPAGAAPIAALLARFRLAGGMAPRPAGDDFHARMPAIMRELCAPFLTALSDRVRRDGGHPGDVSTILGLCVGEYVAATAREGKAEEVVEFVKRAALSRLARAPSAP